MFLSVDFHVFSKIQMAALIYARFSLSAGLFLTRSMNQARGFFLIRMEGKSSKWAIRDGILDEGEVGCA